MVTVDAYRKIGDYSSEPCPRCLGETQHMLSAPAVIVWNGTRRFPNLSEKGDGAMTFASRTAYESHLKANGISEVGISAPIKTPHGNRVVRVV